MALMDDEAQERAESTPQAQEYTQTSDAGCFGALAIAGAAIVTGISAPALVPLLIVIVIAAALGVQLVDIGNDAITSANSQAEANSGCGIAMTGISLMVIVLVAALASVGG